MRYFRKWAVIGVSAILLATPGLAGRPAHAARSPSPQNTQAKTPNQADVEAQLVRMLEELKRENARRGIKADRVEAEKPDASTRPSKAADAKSETATPATVTVVVPTDVPATPPPISVAPPAAVVAVAPAAPSAPTPPATTVTTAPDTTVTTTPVPAASAPPAVKTMTPPVTSAEKSPVTRTATPPATSAPSPPATSAVTPPATSAATPTVTSAATSTVRSAAPPPAAAVGPAPIPASPVGRQPTAAAPPPAAAAAPLPPAPDGPPVAAPVVPSNVRAPLPAIEGFVAADVQAFLGAPSTVQQGPAGSLMWHYLTPAGRQFVYFIDGVATVTAPRVSGAARSAPPPRRTPGPQGACEGVTGATGFKTVAVIHPDSPVFIEAKFRSQPLTLLALKKTAEVVAAEGAWYLIRFNDERWGRRVGYIHCSDVVRQDN